jgi:SnoaL-like domain
MTRSVRPRLRPRQRRPVQRRSTFRCPSFLLVAQRFVEGYRRAWDTWDVEGFLDLFADDVVYAAHPLEIVVGRESLRTYLRKEEAEPGGGQRANGSADRRRTGCDGGVLVNALDGSMSVAGCLIFKVADGDGRCLQLPGVLV